MARLDRLKGVLAFSWWDDDGDEVDLLERLKLRHQVVRAFLQLLSQGTLVLTGLVAPIKLSSRREIIPPDIIDALRFDFPGARATAPGLELIHLKVHAVQARENRDVGLRASAEPLAGAGMSADAAFSAASNAAPEFTHSADYGRVTMRGHAFHLAGGLCQLVALLHAASRSNDPWCVGKQLMADCGYNTTLLSDAFRRHQSPSWRELVAGNGRGLYRLNLMNTAIASAAA
ncbi:hypothetical protein NGM99_21505 [Mesorhizobium sp. RP14(2022)]|uniref:Uncharacterized protein n=1 Tax=Mesorhizobium liriopis TaxID=2953882 RepID=A0ABT1CC15_9HYPH|nr:hypothetical protein [Mesorhizobium liriopis]